MNNARLDVLIGDESRAGMGGMFRTRELECTAKNHLARLVASFAIGDGRIRSDLCGSRIRNIYSLRGHDDKFVGAIWKRSGINFLIGFEGLHGRSKKIS